MMYQLDEMPRHRDPDGNLCEDAEGEWAEAWQNRDGTWTWRCRYCDRSWDYAERPRKIVEYPELTDKFTVLEHGFDGQQYDIDEVRGMDPHHVWTVVEGDTGQLYALTGFHLVNRLYYMVTAEPWTDADSAVDYIA